MRVFVVGGGVAGVFAALAASGRGAETTLFEATKTPGLSRAHMPLLISDGWSESDLLLPESGRLADSGVKVRKEERVVRVERAEGKIRVLSVVGGGEMGSSCDSLVICTGSAGEAPAVRGSSKRNVFLLKGPADYLALSAGLDVVRTVAVSGPIPAALKLGEILAGRRAKVRVYCGKGGLERQFPRPFAEAIRREAESLHEQGRLVLVDGSIESILGVDRVEAVASEGAVQTCDAVVLVPKSVPSFPSVDCKKGRNGGLLVDSSMSTSFNGVFAAGDSAEIKFKAGSVPARLFSTSRMGGEVAGINAAGGKASASASWAVEQTYFGLEFCSAGLSEQEARAVGLNAATESTESTEARTRGGKARRTLVSMVFDKSTHQVYGLQAAGWRASSISSAASLIVSLGLSAEQLVHSEYPYSPGSSQDVSPIALTAGKVASRERD